MLVLKERIKKFRHSVGLLLVLAMGISGLSYHSDPQIVERNNSESDKKTKEPATKSHMQGLGLHNKFRSTNHPIPQCDVSFVRNNLKHEICEIEWLKKT